MTDKHTTIRINESTWVKLNQLRSVGVTFDYVINELLEELNKSREVIKE